MIRRTLSDYRKKVQYQFYKRLRSVFLKEDTGLGDTVARFTHWVQCPRWLRNWLPHWLWVLLPDPLPFDRFVEWLIVDVLRFPTCGCPNRRRRLNTAVSYYATTLTIGMPNHNDIEGVWATLLNARSQAFSAKIQDKVELLVVDQTPPAPGERRKLENYCKKINQSGIRCRYVEYTQVMGSGPAKNQVFLNALSPLVETTDTPAIREARKDNHWVICVDCHVHLENDSLKRIYRWMKRNRQNVDLHYGCLIYDENPHRALTHMECWRKDKSYWVSPSPWIGSDLLMGSWRSDKRGQTHRGKPFEIDGCGGWFLICRKSAWFGFHPLLKGHGGEEWFLAEAFRQMGRQVWCLPFARAYHRFIRTPNSVNYGENSLTIHNLVVSFKSLGYDPDKLRVSLTWPIQKTRPDGTKYLEPLRDPDWVNKVIDDALVEFKKFENSINQQRAIRANPDLVDEPSRREVQTFLEKKFFDIHLGESNTGKHAPLLVSLARKVRRIAEYPSSNKESSWAFLYAQPYVLIRLGKDCSKCSPDEMARFSGVTELQVEAKCNQSRTCTVASDLSSGLLYVSPESWNSLKDTEDLAKCARMARHFIVIEGVSNPNDVLSSVQAKGMPPWMPLFSAEDFGGIVVLQRQDSDVVWSFDQIKWPRKFEREQPVVSAVEVDDDSFLYIEDFES